VISILVLTKNEQQDLPGCLESVQWSDDVHVFDSGSTDRTAEIAQLAGATLTVRSYERNTLAFGGDEAAHRNWGLTNIAFKHPWVFCIDADERMTQRLVDACLEAATREQAHVAFRVRRRDFFLGTWIRHVQASAFYVRLFKPAALHYERLINPVSVVDGSTGDLDGYLDHFPFSKGIDYWIARHNHYSRLEADQIVRNRSKRPAFSIWKAFTAENFNERRFHQKELFYRAPLRPILKFLILYIGKRGFLDGRAGCTYALLQSVYEYFIVLKVRELETTSRSPQ
jgi:glycosyltransferase involved in cell wall biosynthesis